MSRAEPSKYTTDDLIAKRLDLALQHMREIVANPSRLDEIPASGSTVVILPSDDPEFAAHEREAAERLTAEGRHVVVVTVGAEPITEEGWARLNAPLWRPTWAADLDRDRASVVYDRERDTLFINFSRGQREGWSWPQDDFSYQIIDEETEEAFGYLVPEFLSKAVQYLPSLARVLKIAEFRPLTDAEREILDTISIWHMEPGPPSAPIQPGSAVIADFIASLRQLHGEPMPV